jgi:hypothetical protein
MLTLSQVEPRTPITNTTAVTISAPGSYYLTANISVTSGSAITITASQVTLDLNGFTITGTGTANTGILLAGGDTDITILNGHILGNVFANGINYSGSAPVNVRVSGVSVSGCSAYGILLGTASSTVVESCTVQAIGVWGIEASTVSHSSAYQCGGNAIIANTAENCYGNCTGSGEGLYAGTANDCYGYSSSGYGLYATTATGCYGFTGTGPGGLDANNANNCYGYSSGNGDGLDATTADNCQGVSTGINAGNSSGNGLSAYTANNSAGQSLNASGLNATYTAIGCFGTSTYGIGLNADNASNCYGTSGGPGADGLYAIDIAIGCSGINTGGGTGLRANIANSCAGSGSPRLTVTSPFNMPYP